MVIFRLLGLVLITAALMALGSDALRSLEAHEVQIRSLAEVWSLISQTSYDGFTAWVSGMSPSLATPVASVLAFPSWAVFGVVAIVIGGLIAVASRD
ncbi:MAG: hypothetical protein WBN97_01780 [Parvibaculum sp.]